MGIECEDMLEDSELFRISSASEGRTCETDGNLISKFERAGGALDSSFDAWEGVIRFVIALVPFLSMEVWSFLFEDFSSSWLILSTNSFSMCGWSTKLFRFPEEGGSGQCILFLYVRNCHSKRNP